MDKKTAMSEQTKLQLKEAFLELYAGGGMSDVTVGALTKKAGYNRCTFYNHYEDLQSILCEIEDDVIEQIQTKLEYIFADGILKNIDTIFSETLCAFEEYGNTLYILLRKNGSAAFRQKLQKTTKNNFRELFKLSVNDEQLEYILTFLFSAGLGLIEHWYETEKKYSTEEFLKLSQSLIANGVLGQSQNNVN